MNWGSFRDYFHGVAWKRLTAHEVDPSVSNGHEFQGVQKLKELLGTERRSEIPAVYLLFSDEEGPPERVTSTASWYDSRANDPTRSPEWRLYYPSDAGIIQAKMQPDDLMVIALLESESLAVLLAPKGSERETQLGALFAIDLQDDARVHVQRFGSQKDLSFTAVAILEDLDLPGDLALQTPEPKSGVATDLATEIARELVSGYGRRLPEGRTVATLIHERMPAEDAAADPDGALHRWIEAQAAVYRLWEDEIISRRIRDGFVDQRHEPDIQAFREFTMSLRQSRVSRAGGALQLHTARILRANNVRFDEQVTTENRERPDFVFPGSEAYHDTKFPNSRLHMLGVKFTLKDRWRQVLNEAARIRHKHLLTMDAAVTASGLKAMAASDLTLVIPDEIRRGYPAVQQAAISTVRDFIALVREK